LKSGVTLYPQKNKKESFFKHMPMLGIKVNTADLRKTAIKVLASLRRSAVK